MSRTIAPPSLSLGQLEEALQLTQTLGIKASYDGQPLETAVARRRAMDFYGGPTGDDSEEIDAAVTSRDPLPHSLATDEVVAARRVHHDAIDEYTAAYTALDEVMDAAGDDNSPATQIAVEDAFNREIEAEEKLRSAEHELRTTLRQSVRARDERVATNRAYLDELGAEHAGDLDITYDMDRGGVPTATVMAWSSTGTGETFDLDGDPTAFASQVSGYVRATLEPDDLDGTPETAEPVVEAADGDKPIFVNATQRRPHTRARAGEGERR